VWRRHVATARKTLRARTEKPKKRRAPNRHQLRCPGCLLFVKRLCQAQYNPCGMCPPCCPGGHKPPPKPEQAQP